MAKTKFLSVLFLLLPFWAFSQTTVTVGKPYEVVDSKIKWYFSKNDEILTVKTHEDGLMLQKFNSSSLTLIQAKVYEDFEKGTVFEEIEEFEGKYYLFYSVWDKKNRIEQLYSREINFETGSFKGKATNLMKVDKKISGDLSSGFGATSFGFGFRLNTANAFNVTGKFAFHFSVDRSKMMIQYRVIPEEKRDEKNYDVIGFNVFKKDLQVLWKKEITMPYTEKKMNNIDYTVDSDGNAYTLATIYNDNTTDIKKRRKDEKSNYHIELLKFSTMTGNLSNTTINLDKKFINSVWIYEGKNAEMVCAGFYNNGMELDAANGIVVFKITKDGKIKSSKSYEIPLEILNQNESAREKRRNNKDEEKGKAQFEDLELTELIINEDGSLTFIGEQNYIVAHTTTTQNGGTRTTYSYHYNDILIAKIDANEKLAWMRKLPKQQVGRAGKGGMSFTYFNDEKNHYLVYLDHVENKDLSINEVPKSHSDGHGGYLTAYKLSDAKGEVSKYSILDTRDVKGTEIYQVSPDRLLFTAKNEFVFEAYKKKKEDILIKVNFAK